MNSDKVYSNNKESPKILVSTEKRLFSDARVFIFSNSSFALRKCIPALNQLFNENVNLAEFILLGKVYPFLSKR